MVLRFPVTTAVPMWVSFPLPSTREVCSQIHGFGMENYPGPMCGSFPSPIKRVLFLSLVKKSRGREESRCAESAVGRSVASPRSFPLSPLLCSVPSFLSVLAAPMASGPLHLWVCDQGRFLCIFFLYIFFMHIYICMGP